MFGYNAVKKLRKKLTEARGEIKALIEENKVLEKLVAEGVELLEASFKTGAELTKEVSEKELEIARLRRELYEMSKLLEDVTPITSADSKEEETENG